MTKDNHQQNTRSGSVMDVRPRRPQQYINNRSSAASHHISASPSRVPEPVAPKSTEVNTDTEQIQSTTVTPEVIGEVIEPTQNPKVGLRPELLAQAEKETKDQEKAKQAILEARKAHKNRGPIIVSILAIIIASLLAGVAVNAYMSQSKTANTMPPSDDAGAKSQVRSIQEPKPATTTDLDSLNQELDTVINTNDDAKELPADSFSDNSVGL